ncbi:Tetratricopeptide (TPR) repeat [Rhizobiales bacterium GAS188]|nr:Tetratricopeptide (TPR) repeat [Rhizobiales bacterium GAS188]
MAHNPAQRLAPTRVQTRIGLDYVQIARELIAEALRHVRAGRTAEAAACLTSHGEIALQDDFACNLLGLIHASNGEHLKALDGFERALRIRPGRLDVIANRAITLQHLGRLEAAIACYDEVLKARPDDPQMLFQRGTASHLLGRSEAALADYDQALNLKPAHPEARAGRAILLHQLGRREEALACYDKAILLDPADPSSHYNRGNTLRELSRPDEALAAYREALRLRPAYAEALCGCAMVLNEKALYAEALACCAQALRHAPTHFPALFNQANILYAAGRIEEACATYEAVIRLKPGDADALCNRAAALLEACRLEEALISCDQALGIKPDFPEALSNRGNILQKLQRFEEALSAYEAALALRPAYLDVLCSRGVALKQVGRYEEALASFDAALVLEPQHAHTQNNRGALLLLLGDFERGWEAYESRWLKENLPVNALPRVWPEWSGGPIAGKRILILDEQGLGDVIQFSRYLSLLAEAGAEVSFLCRKSMHRLLSNLPGKPRLIEATEPGESFDYEAALVSLPRAFKTRGDTVPAAIPYLRAEETLAAKWAERIGRQGFRVGISWQGSPNPKADMARAVPLRAFAPLKDIPGVRLISLQKNGGVDQLGDAGLTFEVERLSDDFDAGPDAFVDTAAVMANLDLVITCDTSIAHLAGALGKPVWVALKSVPDWRFLLDREDTPWYPNMRLFRQSRRGQWDEVFARMSQALDELTRPGTNLGATSIRIPGAIGELIDKITILEIKSAHIGEAVKLKNVHHELDLLRSLCADGAFSGPRLEALARELKLVNQALWNIEDAIRICEQRGEFGDEFIALARSVYKTNDRRAALKRDINLLFNSAIVEEKSYCGG